MQKTGLSEWGKKWRALIINERKALCMNQIFVVMHYEWTLGCGPGNGPQVFCFSWGRVTGAREGWREKLREWGNRKTLTELSMQANGNHILLSCFLVHYQQQGLPSSCPWLSWQWEQMLQLSTSQQLGISTATAFHTWLKNILCLQKAFRVTFFMAPNCVFHYSHRSPFIPVCHR